MDCTLRDATLEDIDSLIAAGWPGTNVEELKRFRSLKLDAQNGRQSFTGSPDTVWVALSKDGRLAGYIHFWTDCCDDYEKVLVAVAADPSLPTEIAAAVTAFLDIERQLHPL